MDSVSSLHPQTSKEKHIYLTSYYLVYTQTLGDQECDWEETEETVACVQNKNADESRNSSSTANANKWGGVVIFVLLGQGQF